MKKRIFAFLIAFVLILTMSVLACAAADSTPQEDVTGTEPDIAQVGRIYPVIKAPAMPMNVSVSDTTHLGCLSASHARHFFSSPLRMEVCILSAFFIPSDIILSIRGFSF